MNRYGIDFNIAKHLEAILSCRSVTEAAHKVGITQPAMSNSLSKMRDHFGDSLLVKNQGEYVRTSLGEELYPKIIELIDQFDNVFVKKHSFDPLIEEREFTIAVSDYAGFVFGPHLLLHLLEEYPKIKVHLVPLEDQYSEESLGSHIDLALVTRFGDEFPKNLNHKVFHNDQFSVAGCVDHLESKKRMTLSSYLNASHIVTRPKGLDMSVIDKELKRQGHKREVFNSVPHFAVAVRSVLKTPHLISLPYMILKEMSQFIPLKIFPAPFDLPSINNSLLWHKRVEEDQANLWLRNEIVNLFTELSL